MMFVGVKMAKVSGTVFFEFCEEDRKLLEELDRKLTLLLEDDSERTCSGCVYIDTVMGNEPPCDTCGGTERENFKRKKNADE